MEDRPILHPVPDTLRPFDVYRMPVRFEEDKTKSRNHYVACIIINTDGEGGLAVKLTSNPKWNGIGDIRLRDWEHAGLSHETTARCTQLVRFHRSDIQGYTGSLSHGDAVNVAAAIASIPPEMLIWL